MPAGSTARLNTGVPPRGQSQLSQGHRQGPTRSCMTHPHGRLKSGVTAVWWWGRLQCTAPPPKNKKIPSKNNMSLASALAAAQTPRLGLSFHVTRAEGQPIYSVAPCAREISFSLKQMMTGEIKYQKVKLCQNAFLKTVYLIFLYCDQLHKHQQVFGCLEGPK